MRPGLEATLRRAIKAGSVFRVACARRGGGGEVAKALFHRLAKQGDWSCPGKKAAGARAGRREGGEGSACYAEAGL